MVKGVGREAKVMKGPWKSGGSDGRGGSDE